MKYFITYRKLKEFYHHKESDRAFGKRFNIPPDRISYWKHRPPSRGWLEKLSKKFHKPMEWFVTEGGDDEKNINGGYYRGNLSRGQVFVFQHLHRILLGRISRNGTVTFLSDQPDKSHPQTMKDLEMIGRMIRVRRKRV